MAIKANVHEAKTHFSRLLERVHKGEEVIIANRGEPVARLVPAEPVAGVKKTGSAGAILDWVKKHPLPTYARRSAAEIDAAIEEERASWD